MVADTLLFQGALTLLGSAVVLLGGAVAYYAQHFGAPPQRRLQRLQVFGRWHPV